MGECVTRPNKVAQNQLPKLEELEHHSAKRIAPSSRNFNTHKALSENQLYQLLSEYFDLFDTDHDDSLTFPEVVEMLKLMQANTNKKRKHKIKIDMEEAQAFFSKIDVNGDKRVSKEEFYRFYKKN